MVASCKAFSYEPCMTSNKTAFVFPGQGSQAITMGKTLAEAFPIAKQTFQEVDDALEQHLSKIMFSGDIDELTQTENAQPAIMAVGMAVVRVLEQQTKKPLQGRFVAGHSLGEYTALCAAGTFSLKDTAKLLKTRGQAMQAAVPAGNGAMAALLGLSLEQVEAITAANDCVIANDNAPGQIVISGASKTVEAGMQDAKQQGAKRSVLLNVSAPFHSPLMLPAALVMQEALKSTLINIPALTLIANVTAAPTNDTTKIKELLVQQVTGRVRWRESIEFMAENGIETVIECGHGKVLSGLIKRINRDLKTINLQEPADFDALVAATGL